MAEQDTDVLDQEVPEVIERATAMGWTPKEKFKGDPDKWKPAAEFVEYGEMVLPILRSQNREMHQQLATSNAALQDLQRQVAAGSATMKQLEDFYKSETERAVKEAKRGLAAELKAAREAGDTDREVELLGEIADLNAPPPPKPVAKAADTPPAPPPAYLDWAAKNTWIDKDRKKSRRAVLIGQEIIEDMPHLNGKMAEFYNELDDRLAEEFGSRDREPDDKVSGSAGAGRRTSSGGGTGAKSYDSLPADAKSQCDADARQFVGEGRMFKTKQEWQKHYAQVYWSQE